MPTFRSSPPPVKASRMSGLSRIVGQTFKLPPISFVEKVLIACTLVVITMAALDRGLVPPPTGVPVVAEQLPGHTRHLLVKAP